MREFPAASIPGKSSAIVGGVVVAIAVAVVVAAVVLQSRVTFEQKQLLEEKREEEETKHWKSISAENELCTFLKIPPPPFSQSNHFWNSNPWQSGRAFNGVVHSILSKEGFTLRGSQSSSRHFNPCKRGKPLRQCCSTVK